MKVRIKTKFLSDDINNSYDLKGIYNNCVLSFNEDSYKIKIDFKNRKLIRECDEYIITIDFDNNLEVLYKKINSKVNVPIEVKNIDINENNFSIKYITIDDNKNITYSVNWEEM